MAEAITRTGDAVTVVALPLTAILVLDAGPAELALIGAAQAFPILSLSIPLGTWVDRRQRRWPLLVSADLARAVLLVAVPLAGVLGSLTLPLLAAIALLVSVAGTVFDLASAGWVPRLVRGDALHLVNARLELARSGALVSGPAMGGALVTALTAPIALLADAASFVASAALITSIRNAEPAVQVDGVKRRIAEELMAGARFIASQPLVAAVWATVATNNLARSIAMAVAVLYLVDEAAMGPAAIGIAFALGNSGFVAGALVARRFTQRLGVGRTMQLGVGLFGPSMLLFALSPAMLAGPTFALMLFAHGFGIAIHNVNQVTIRQVLTPDRLRARVLGVGRLVGFGSVPIGIVIGGVIGELAGVRSALILGAVAHLAGSVPYALVRVMRIRTISEVEPAA